MAGNGSGAVPNPGPLAGWRSLGRVASKPKKDMIIYYTTIFGEMSRPNLCVGKGKEKEKRKMEMEGFKVGIKPVLWGNYSG